MPRQTRILTRVASLCATLGALSTASEVFAQEKPKDAQAAPPQAITQTITQTDAPGEPAPDPRPPGPFWTGPRVAAGIWMGAAVSAIVVGAVYASKVDSAMAQLKWHCWSTDQDRCDEEGFRLRRQATHDGRTSNIALGVGFSAIVLSVALGFWNPEAHPQQNTITPRVAIAPLIGVNGSANGVLLLGSF